jgi:hypothetical protein
VEVSTAELFRHRLSPEGRRATLRKRVVSHMTFNSVKSNVHVVAAFPLMFECNSQDDIMLQSEAVLAISRENHAIIDQAPNIKLNNVYTAVAGSAIVVKDGQDVSADSPNEGQGRRARCSVHRQ